MHVLLQLGATVSHQKEWKQALTQALPEITWHTHLPLDPLVLDAIECAVVANPEKGSLQGLPQLKWIQSLWAGVESLLADETIPPHVIISRMVDPALTAAMQESALWASLHLHRRFGDYAHQQQKCEWRSLPQQAAGDIKIGVLGLGHMGSAVATRLSSIGYEVWGYRLHENTSHALAPNIGICHQKQALYEALANTAIVINLLPLTKQTQGILNRSLFYALPQGAHIVNFARGGHLVEKDLLQALDAKHIDRAILDVHHQEPLAIEHPFWSHPRITLWPHIAATTTPTTAAKVVAQQWRAWQAKAPVLYTVKRHLGY